VADLNGVKIHWLQEGRADAPAILLLNSLGTDLGMWDGVTAELSRDFLVLRYDARGHGASGAVPGDYTMDDLVSDALGVLDEAGVDRAVICGVSLGALTAAHMAKLQPKRVNALVLANIASSINPADWEARAQLVRKDGIGFLVEPSMERFLSEAFRQTDVSQAGRIRSALSSVDPQGYAACCMAIATTPTLPIDSALAEFSLLSIAGARDPAVPADHARAIASATGGMLHILDTAHLSPVEDPEGFSSAIRQFMASTSEAVRANAESGNVT
jgi:3-oxoadipate enol-lactonase/4-carboxymuconolactone decarboxylase